MALDRAAAVPAPTQPEVAVVRSKLRLNSLWFAALGHFLLTALFTYPLIFNFNSALPGLLVEDRDQNLWNLWWVPRALLNLKNPFQTDFIYYPDGVSLYFHTLHPLNGIISYPLQLLFGLTMAYNFIIFFSFVMAGIGAYWLLNYLCRHRAAAFAASLIFAYAPYHIGTLKGLMQLISLEWLSFYLLFLLKATRETERRGFNIGLAVFFLICTALTDWYYVLFLLMFTAIYLFYPAKKPFLSNSIPILENSGLSKRVGRRQLAPTNITNWLKSFITVRWLIIALIPGLFALIMLPVLIPMVRELGQTNYYLPTETAAQQFSPTLAAFFVPPTTSTIFGGFAQNFSAQYLTGWLAAQVYLGYVALGLALVGLVMVRATRFWGIVFLVFWLLSFGPTLRLNGPEPGWPMPFALIQNWPVIKITRSPDRFIVIAMLALAVCAAFGLTRLIELSQKWRPFKNGWAIAALAGLFITLEFLQIPYPLNTVSPSPFFEKLGQDTSDYALIELPAQGGFWSGAPRMANQTIHHKRIFNGYISREYEHPFVNRTPGFQELMLLKERPDIFRPAQTGANLPGDRSWYAAFSYYKVRYLVLYAPQTQKERDTTDPAKSRRAIARVVPDAKPIFSDEKMEVYTLPLLPESERHPFAQIGDGWYEAEPDESGAGRHRWAAGPANLNLLWQGPGERAAHLSFNLGLLSGEQRLRLTLDGATIWDGLATAAQQTVQLEVKLKPGAHRLDFYPTGQPQSPQALGLGPDPRKLLFYISDLALE